MRWWGILLASVLSGCALLPASPAPDSSLRPPQPDNAAFALNGRIAIKYDEIRHSAGLRWVHRAQSDEVLLLAPLGQTVARVYRDAYGATLDDGSKQYRAEDVEALMQQALGWRLPLDGLRYWILGMPAAERPAQIKRDDNGRIVMLHQDGWEVAYLRHADASPNSLPTRLQLNRDDLQVQLLIDEWDWSLQ